MGSITGLDDVERTQILLLPGLNFNPSVVQPVASRYTDWGIPVPPIILMQVLNR
jgi:hypothetical protein